MSNVLYLSFFYVSHKSPSWKLLQDWNCHHSGRPIKIKSPAGTWEFWEVWSLRGSVLIPDPTTSGKHLRYPGQSVTTRVAGIPPPPPQKKTPGGGGQSCQRTTGRTFTRKEVGGGDQKSEAETDKKDIFIILL